jgi:hypothetical protein
MGWMQYSVRLVGDLAWPAVVLILVLQFKREIAKKISELKIFRSRYAEAEFEHARTSTEAALEEARRSPITQNEGISDTSGVPEPPAEHPYQSKTDESAPSDSHANFPLSDTERYWTPIIKIAPDQPLYAVVVAGWQLDKSILRLATPFGLPPSPLSAAVRLAEAGVIPTEVSAAAVNLLQLRDRVRGSFDFPITTSGALSYIQSAKDLCDYLDSLPLNNKTT